MSTLLNAVLVTLLSTTIPLSLFPLQTMAQPNPMNEAAVSWTEQEVTVGTRQLPLPGTLTLPKGTGPFPAIVLVQGSGPHDRDETIGPNKPFRDLAWGLAAQGIAVLRYDKRTKVHPGSFGGKFTIQEEITEDALSAVDLLRRNRAIDPKRVFVLGHSLGGMIAPRLARLNPRLAGLIILAGPTRPFEDLFLEQVEYLSNLDGSISPEEAQFQSDIRQQVQIIKSPRLAQATPTALLLGAPPAYWLDLKRYKPAETAAQLTQPILILQGDRDYQVTLKDFQGWQTALAGRRTVTLKRYANLNHLFMVSGPGPANPGEYLVPGVVDRTVITDIANWVKGLPR